MQTDELTNKAEWTRIGRWQVSSELFLDVIFTGRCNRCCPYCIARTREFCREDAKAWRKSLEKAFDLFPIKSVVILGGEATADPLLWEKLTLVEEQTRKHAVERVILTTNGVTLTDPVFLKGICESCVNAVNLSRMHDDQERNDMYFGGPTPAIEDIRRIHDALSGSGKTLRLNVNVWRGNLDTVQEMERFTDTFGGCCDAVKFSPLMDTAMFGTVPAVERFTWEKAMTDDEIRVLYDAFASRQTPVRKKSGVLGFVDYAEVMRGSQRVLLKYAQVEDKYDRSRVIPTLKLYPNGSLSNEWDYGKNILDEMQTV